MTLRVLDQNLREKVSFLVENPVSNICIGLIPKPSKNRKNSAITARSKTRQIDMKLSDTEGACTIQIHSEYEKLPYYIVKTVKNFEKAIKCLDKNYKRSTTESEENKMLEDYGIIAPVVHFTKNEKDFVFQSGQKVEYCGSKMEKQSRLIVDLIQEHNKSTSNAFNELNASLRKKISELQSQLKYQIKKNQKQTKEYQDSLAIERSKNTDLKIQLEKSKQKYQDLKNSKSKVEVSVIENDKVIEEYDKICGMIVDCHNDLYDRSKAYKEKIDKYEEVFPSQILPVIIDCLNGRIKDFSKQIRELESIHLSHSFIENINPNELSAKLKTRPEKAERSKFILISECLFTICFNLQLIYR